MSDRPPAARGARAGDGGRSAVTLLRDPRFGTYLAGNVTSNVGNWFQIVAASIVVFELTGSSTMVGVTGVLQFAGLLLLGPYAGSLADRFDRRRLVQGAAVLGSLAAGSLAVMTAVLGVDGLPGVWPVLLATGVLGISYAVSTPTLLSLVPSLVEVEDLDTAIALNSSSFTVARGVGPALGGLVVGVAGAEVAFAVNAVSFLGLILALHLVARRSAQPEPTVGSATVRASLRRAVRSRPVLVTMLATAAVGLSGDPVNTLSPAIADRLGGGDVLVGLQLGAFGGGAALGTFVIGRARAVAGRWTLIRRGFVGLAAGLLVYAWAPTATVALLALLGGGLAFMFTANSLNADLQMRVDEAERGRMMALWTTAFLGSRPLVSVLNGAMADAWGTPAAVSASAALALLAGLLLARGHPDDAVHPSR